jgi:type III protein arginine methyltransferase
MTTYAVGSSLNASQIDALALAATGNARALALLAEKIAAGSQRGRAVELALMAQALLPDDPEIRSIIRPIVANSVPRWHFNIVKDEQRNAAFEAAMQRAVTSQTSVLDIGTGTGLLAMIAAKCGARQVVSCELNPVVAQTAREILSANGLAEKVSVVSKHSMHLDPEADMDGLADLIVAEIISNDFVGEGVLPALNDAARRLMKPGGQMIPQGGSIMIALAHWDRLGDTALGDVCGFDMTPFNALRPAKYRVQVDDPKLALRSDAGKLFTFDFCSSRKAAATSQVALTADGKLINGIAQWICLDMDETGTLENRPENGARSSWDCQFFPLDHEIHPDLGAVVDILGAQTANALRIWAS